MIRCVYGLALCAAIVAAAGPSKYKETCEKELTAGIKVLEEVYSSLASYAEHDRNSRQRKARSLYEGHTDKKTGESDDDCDSGGKDCYPPAGMRREKRSLPSYPSAFPRLMSGQLHSGFDPLAYYAEKLHTALSNVSSCDPTFTDLNSVTEAQLYGFLSIIATRTPGPFCSLCHRLTEEIHEKIIEPFELLSGKGHGIVSELLSHLPSPKTLCSALAPGCYDGYNAKVADMNEAVTCLECSACNVVLNVVQHRFLLNKQLIDGIYNHLAAHMFHDACTTMCCIHFPDPLNLSWQQCMDMSHKYFYRIYEAVVTLLKPERLCVLELGWCELGENPNAIHCVRELCEAGLAAHPSIAPICSFIPDRPPEADKFLNVHKTKVYKEKKAHHYAFEEKMKAIMAAEHDL